MPTPITSLALRFLRMVKKTEACWLWTGTLDRRGYGRIWRIGNHTRDRAHRVSWEIHRGPIPEGSFVLHTCDVRHCVNPDHLFLGDHEANMADMAAKGRGASRPSVTDNQIAAMVEKRMAGWKLREIAAEFGVTIGVAQKYLKLAGVRKNWGRKRG